MTETERRLREEIAKDLDTQALYELEHYTDRTLIRGIELAADVVRHGLQSGPQIMKMRREGK